jgi:hypothetical protein
MGALAMGEATFRDVPKRKYVLIRHKRACDQKPRWPLVKLKNQKKDDVIAVVLKTCGSVKRSAIHGSGSLSDALVGNGKDRGKGKVSAALGR